MLGTVKGKLESSGNSEWLGKVLAAVLVAGSSCGFALDPSLDIRQYAHTSWKVRDGFVKGPINAIAQTPDGYLWLGTEFGLLRFDGVRPVPWQLAPDQKLPSNYIRSVLAARDGTLWIGTEKGLASWKDGKLTLVVEDVPNTNGLAFSPDEKTLYVNGSFDRYVKAYDVKPDDTVANGRMLIDMQGNYPAWTAHARRLEDRRAVQSALAQESISLWG